MAKWFGSDSKFMVGGFSVLNNGQDAEKISISVYSYSSNLYSLSWTYFGSTDYTSNRQVVSDLFTSGTDTFGCSNYLTT